MIKQPIINLSYESPSTRVILVSPMRCIAGSNGQGKLNSMEVNSIYVDEDDF